MKKQKDFPLTASACVLGIGVLFIILGILRGEAQVVLEKAIRICMECIGIG